MAQGMALSQSREIDFKTRSTPAARELLSTKLAPIKAHTFWLCITLLFRSPSFYLKSEFLYTSAWASSTPCQKIWNDGRFDHFPRISDSPIRPLQLRFPVSWRIRRGGGQICQSFPAYRMVFVQPNN
jgi:hypothetical protein